MKISTIFSVLVFSAFLVSSGCAHSSDTTANRSGSSWNRSRVHRNSAVDRSRGRRINEPDDNGIRVSVFPDGSLEVFRQKVSREELARRINDIEDQSGFPRIVHLHAMSSSVNRGDLENLRNFLIKNKIPRVVIVTATSFKCNVREVPFIQ